MESLKGPKAVLLLLLYFLAALVTIALIPRLDVILNPTAGGPSFISTFGTTLVMIILTGGMLQLGIKSDTTLDKQFILYTFLFTSLIIMVKFAYSPISLYFVNQTQSFDSSFSNREPASMFFASAGIAALYLVIFYAIYGSAKRKYNKETQVAPAAKISFDKIIRWILFLGVMAILLYFFLIFLLFPFLLSFTYIQYVFDSAMGMFIAISLVGAVYCARKSFMTVEEQAAKVRDVTLLSSFLLFGAGLVLAYHALWVVFMLVLGNIWPFQTYSSK